jgi:hypothetical protein
MKRIGCVAYAKTSFVTLRDISDTAMPRSRNEHLAIETYGTHVLTLARSESVMTRLSMVAAALSVAAAAFTEAAAQDTAHGVISGKVVRTNSTPVPAAVVTLDSSRVQVMTDSAGAFTLREVVTGRHRLTARRLGFAMASVLTTVTASESTTVVLRLEPAPRMLPEVEVRGLKVTDLPRFTAAVERASRNNGAAFTADGIAKENPLDTKSLLERLPGVHVSDRSIIVVCDGRRARG